MTLPWLYGISSSIRNRCGLQYFCTNAVVLCVILINASLLFVFISDYLFKLSLIGDSGVGKTSLLLRFAVSGHPCSMH